MRPRLRALAFAAALAGVAVVGRDANAYVREVSNEQNQLFWSSSCETATIYLNGFTGMTADEVAKSIGAAAAAWGPGQVTCPTSVTGDAGKGHPSFEILTQLSTSGTAPVLQDAAGKPISDGQNEIVFETGYGVFPPGALAYTTIFTEGNGHIVEVDIGINAGDPYTVWGNLDPGVPTTANGIVRMDLQSVITHEFGHFLGLGHTCGGSASGQGSDNGNQPMGVYALDDQNNPIPDCTTMPTSSEAKQAAAVMWYTIDQGTTAKRVLTSDDERGVCGIYPSGGANMCTANTPDDGCGCTAGGHGGGTATGLAFAFLALTVARRRVRRAR
jgi:hypothetical protein